MRILLAGGTGLLGAPLMTALVAGGHHVTGIARNPAGAATLVDRGATPVLCDVLDRDGLLRAVTGLHADAVINELTSLKKAPARFSGMRATNRLRIDGTANLVEAAASIGASRFLTQSIVFGYGYVDHGSRRLAEDEPFGTIRGDETDEPIAAMVSTEQQAFATGGGIALRYGLFYGGDIADIARMLGRRSLPVPRTWRGSIPMIHHRDAATATVAALHRGIPGQAYNLADDGDTSWSDYVRTVAAVTGAPTPLAIPDAAVRAVAPYAGELMTRVNLRVSTERARTQLGWAPRYPTIAEGLAVSA